MKCSINYDNQYKTKEAKGNIPAFTLVTCKQVYSYDKETGLFQDKNGNENDYCLDELTGFGYIKYNKGTFDIVDEESEISMNNNERYLIGRAHISPNVRGSKYNFRFWEDCLYSGTLGNGYDYAYRELSDDEVIDILLNEILYDHRPGLDGTSCVGTTKKGIDMDPNYHDGNYFLPNNKDYTMTWCGNTVIIREGIDGGWYPGKKDVGREIYNGKMDWNRYKTAKIKKAAINELSNAKSILDNYPEVIDLIVDKIKNDDKFKLANEFK